MNPVILVKHAMPRVDESQPPRSWPLSDEGRAASVRFADKLRPFGVSRMLASSEPKAADTGAVFGQALGLPVEINEAFVEHRRTATTFQPRDEFHATIARLFDEPDTLVFGEETANQAFGRFAAALDPIVAEPREGALLIVCHGTVLSLWVGRRLGIDPMTIWPTLTMPGAVVVDGDAYQLVHAE